MNKNNEPNVKKWILGAVALLVAGLGIVYFFSTQNKVQVTKTGDLALPPFGKYNNESAKKLILLPFRAQIDPAVETFKGDQILGYGLLGASLLDTGDEYPMLGYRSFFLGGTKNIELYGVTSKMETTFLIQGNIFLIEPDLSIAATDSIIRKREAAIYAIAYGLDDRYTYKYSHEMVSDRNSILRSNKLLLNVLREANQVFSDLKNAGYEDLTLKHALGILHASLRNDGVNTGSINESGFGTPQIYADALSTTLGAYPSESPKGEGTFLKILTKEMGLRGINMLDLAFYKKDHADDTAALIEIIRKDLDKIAK